MEKGSVEMRTAVFLLLVCSIFFFLRAVYELVLLKRKRAYPPAVLLKQRAFAYGCFGGGCLLSAIVLNFLV
jgi:hypothetical protein